jgi:hypothetical protein
MVVSSKVAAFETPAAIAASVSPSARLALHFRAEGSAGLKGFQVSLLKGFDQVTIPAFMVLLGEGKQAHQNQSRQDTSGYDVLHHGCHSTGDRAAKDDEPMGAAVNAPQPRTACYSRLIVEWLTL